MGRNRNRKRKKEKETKKFNSVYKIIKHKKIFYFNAISLYEMSNNSYQNLFVNSDSFLYKYNRVVSLAISKVYDSAHFAVF